jgi:hypothetical protein
MAREGSEGDLGFHIFIDYFEASHNIWVAFFM